MKKYKYELHCHTGMVSRCGRVHPKEIVKLHKEQGYSGIVVTDHYSPMTWRNPLQIVCPHKTGGIDFYLSAYREMKKYEDDDFSVMFGIELRHYGTANDYLVYGVEEEWFKKQGNLMSLFEKDAYKLMHQQGYLVYQAHPFRTGIRRCNPDFIDGVEVFNGKCNKHQNDQAYQWAKENNKLMVSGSDFHVMKQLAKGGIITTKQIKNNTDLLEVLKSQNFEMIQNY